MDLGQPISSFQQSWRLRISSLYSSSTKVGEELSMWAVHSSIYNQILYLQILGLI